MNGLEYKWQNGQSTNHIKVLTKGEKREDSFEWINC